MKQQSQIQRKSMIKTRNSDQFLSGEKKNFLSGNNVFLPPQAHNSLQSAESASHKLPDKVRRKMEHSLGENFSDVKINQDSDLAKELNAIAFTIGNKISFAPGMYNPFSQNGQELIGHELAHVVQQKKSGVSPVNFQNEIRVNRNNQAEKEADHAGQSSAKGKKARRLSGTTGIGQPSVQRKEKNENKTTGDYIAQGGDKTNATTNIIGGIMDRLTKNLEAASRIAKEAGREAAAAKQIALSKATAAKKAIQAAGSGKSKILSGLASKAAKEANEAKRIASIKQVKALKLLEEAKNVKRLLPVAVKVINKLPLNAIGFAASAVNKYLTTSNVTTAGKLADSGITAGFDLAFGMSHPVASAIDAVIGLIPGGERFNISNTMSNSINSITGTAESIITGDISGIGKFYQDSKEGKNTWIMEQAAKAGDFWSEHGGAERTQMVGDFWGGADTVAGRATGFLAAMPGIGHAGEGLGWLTFQAYDKGGDAINYAGEKLSQFDEAIMPEGRTLNPITGIKSLLDGENPFW